MSRYRSDNIAVDWTQKMVMGVDPYEASISVDQIRSMTDVVTPGYHQLVRSGAALPVNPLTADTRKFVSDFGYSEWLITHNFTGAPISLTSVTGSLAAGYAWSKEYTSMYLPWSGGSVEFPDVGLLETDVLANLRTAGTDLGTFAAEFHKTVNLVKGVRGRIHERAKRVALSKGGREAIALRGLSGFLETWLEARYGWRQIAFDMGEITESLNRLTSMTSPFVRASKNSTEEAAYVLDDSPAQLVDHYSPTANATTNNISLVSGIITQRLSKKSVAGAMMQSVAHDIAFVDPLITTFEIIPYSFIVDWFFNIGRNIAAFSPFATGLLKHSFRSSVEELTNEFSATVLLPDSGYHIPHISGIKHSTAQSSVTHYDRVLSEPSFNVQWDLNLSDAKLTDLMAIFVLQHTKLLKDIRRQIRI